MSLRIGDIQKHTCKTYQEAMFTNHTLEPTNRKNLEIYMQDLPSGNVHHTLKAYQQEKSRKIHERATERQCSLYIRSQPKGNIIHQEPTKRQYHTSRPTIGQYNTYSPDLPRGSLRYTSLAHQGAMSTKYNNFQKVQRKMKKHAHTGATSQRYNNIWLA